MANNILLDVLAFGAVVSGILVITAKNPVISVLFLISVFINVAGYLVLLGVAYLGLAYLIVYVGAIAILFLFVIMMLNLRLVELIDTGREYTKNLPLGAVISIAAFALVELLSIATPLSDTKNIIGEGVHVAFNPGQVDAGFNSFLQIEGIGHGLYTYATLWLVIASVIFLLAMVGPIVLCMSPKD